MVVICMPARHSAANAAMIFGCWLFLPFDLGANHCMQRAALKVFFTLLYIMISFVYLLIFLRLLNLSMLIQVVALLCACKLGRNVAHVQPVEDQPV